jgi:hypothetical protein
MVGGLESANGAKDRNYTEVLLRECEKAVASGQYPVLATGDWRLATGNWQLATGNWQLRLLFTMEDSSVRIVAGGDEGHFGTVEGQTKRI